MQFEHNIVTWYSIFKEVLMKYKKCTKCGKEKPLTKEFFHGNGYKFRADCKECVNKRRREDKSLKERANELRRNKYNTDPKYRRKVNSSNLKAKFGIDLKIYDSILEEQEGKCKICKKHFTEFKKRFAVDHCHKTEEKTGEIKIRGLLCANCNKGIGNLQENSETIKRALEYVLKEGDI